MEGRPKIFIGSIIHCIAPFEIQTFKTGFLIVVNKKIVAVDNASELESTKTRLQLTACEEIILSETQLLIPGLVDTHIHASQYPNAGLGYDRQLLDWLQTYTYHLEKKYEDVEFARKIYHAVVRKTLSHGTTTACYFATLHVESSLELADAAIQVGQRAFIGKVNMTELGLEEYKETRENSLPNTERFVDAMLAKKNELVQPIITPRFALSCSADLLKQLGALAKKHDLNIQTHISENQDEVKTVRETFNKDYAKVYDDADLLTPKTVLAHGVFLKPEEKALLAAKGTSVSHCPASNCCLQSGNCDVRALIQAGVNVGLGTDISGGPSPSIIEAMRSTLQNSVQLSFMEKEYQALNCYDAFYLATLGGAKALALQQKIGNFEVGKEFDALIVDLDVKDSALDFLIPCSAQELLQKFIFTSDDRNVVKVYVAGRQVK